MKMGKPPRCTDCGDVIESEPEHDCNQNTVHDCRDCGFIGTWTTVEDACPSCGGENIVER